MRSFTEAMCYASAALGALAGYFSGCFDSFLYALLAFTVIDYITGVMVAILKKELSSEVGYKGIFKKILIFFLVGAAHILDMQILGDSSALRTAVIFFYLSNEGISILENATLIGLPVPKKLQAVLEQLSEEEDEQDADKT